MTRQPAESEFGWCLHSPESTRYRPKGAECHCRRQSSEHGPYGRPDENVTRVVHACVYAGERHDRGRCPQRQPERRQDVSDGNGEGGGGRGVTGGERRRRRHGHPSPLGDTETSPVGAAAFAGHLHGLVHHQGCRADGRQAGERGTPAPTSSEQRQEGRRRGSTAWRSWRSRTPASAVRPAAAWTAAPPIGRRRGRNGRGGAAAPPPVCAALRRLGGR